LILVQLVKFVHYNKLKGFYEAAIDGAFHLPGYVSIAAKNLSYFFGIESMNSSHSQVLN